MKWRSPAISASVLLMEAVWTYAVVAFVVALIADGGKPSLIGVIAVVFLSFGISRALQFSDMSLGVLRAWGAILSLLVFYAIVRADFFGDFRLWDFTWANGLVNDTADTVDGHTAAAFGIPLLWLFWMRGILRGQQSTEFDDVIGSFGIGILIIAFIEVFQGKIDDSPATLGRIAVPYVAFGLFAVGLSHSARADVDQERPFGRTLLIAVGVSIGALAVGAAIVGLFDLVTGVEGARSGANATLEAGKEVGNIIAWPVLKLMDGAFWLLIWLRDHILGTPNPPTPDQGDQGTPQDCVQQLVAAGKSVADATKACNPSPKDLPGWIKAIVRVLIALPVAGAVALSVALLFSRFRRRRDTGEIKESSYQEGRLASDLSNLFQSLLGRMRPNIHLGREHLDPMRRLYFDMVDDGERRGIVREPHQTPNELTPALETAFRPGPPGRITTAFDDVRYGNRHPPEADVRALRDEWERARGET
ncbi:MAG TPA: DUF4129 domain-containing protein [Dehalococcoidia bacterium]